MDTTVSEQKVRDLRKLCFLNVEQTETDDNLRSLCAEYGELLYFKRIPERCLAFALYKCELDANNAMEHLKSVGYKVNYGYKKTRPNIASGSQNNADNNNPPPSNENGSPLTGQCTNCGKLAFRTCARCGDFYCSESCQASNWHSHKRNCFVMPKLIPTLNVSNDTMSL